MKIQNSKLKIIFMGTPQIGAQIFEYLIESKINFCATITRPDKPRGKSKKPEKSPVKIIAERNNIPIYEPQNKSELIKIIKKLKPDLVIVAAFGMIIPEEALNVPKCGMINFHPSLLPLYRGPSPITEAILAGDKKTGVSIIQISESMDAGDILDQKEVNLSGNETSVDLSEKLAKLGAKMIARLIPEIESREITPRPQDNSKASYTKMIKKVDGKIDWQNQTAEEIERMSRAYTPWPGVYSFWKGKKIDLYELSVSTGLGPDQGLIIKGGSMTVSNGKLLIATKSGLVSPKYIKIEGKNKVTAEEFLRGYPDFSSSILR